MLGLIITTITGLFPSFPIVNAKGSWSIESIIESPREGYKPGLWSVHMVNSTDGCSVGNDWYNISGTWYDVGIALHYNGTAWNRELGKDGKPPGFMKYAVFMLNSTDGWCGGWGGAMYHYNGTYWELSDSSSIGTHSRYSVFMVNSTEGWGVGMNGKIIHWNGTKWSNFPTPTGKDIWSVYMVNATKGWAVGLDGKIIYYNGTHWNNTASPTTKDLYSIHMINSTNGWIVGEGGTILHYFSGTWNNYTSPTIKNLFSVFMVNSTEGWAVGGKGTILRYSSGTWTAYASPTGKTLRSLYMINSTLGWAVGDKGIILKYTEEGVQTTELSTKCGDVLFEVDAGNIENLTSLPEDDMPVEGKPIMDFICDFFSFNITDLTPGQTVNITITYPNPVPTNATLWKHGPTIANPVPHWYQVLFQDNDGDNIIIVQFQDGGVGDNDLTANGVIMEPSGIGIPYPPPPPPLAGEIVPNNLTTIGKLLIAVISTLAVTIGLALKRKKLT